MDSSTLIDMAGVIRRLIARTSAHIANGHNVTDHHMAYTDAEILISHSKTLTTKAQALCVYHAAECAAATS